MKKQTKGAFGNKANKGKSKHQKDIESNDLYFMKVASMCNSYLWTAKGHNYDIVDGHFIAKNKKAFLDLMDGTSVEFHSKILYEGEETITMTLELTTNLDGLIFMDRNSGKAPIATKEGNMNMAFGTFLEELKSVSTSRKVQAEKAMVPDSIQKMLEFEYRISMQNDTQTCYEYSDERFFAGFMLRNEVKSAKK